MLDASEQRGENGVEERGARGGGGREGKGREERSERRSRSKSVDDIIA